MGPGRGEDIISGVSAVQARDPSLDPYHPCGKPGMAVGLVINATLGRQRQKGLLAITELQVQGETLSQEN